MKPTKQIIFDFLEGIRTDAVSDLQGKNISQGDIGMQTQAEADGGELSGNHYWYYLVYGRRPGKQPPIDSILGWLQKKGITSDIPERSLAFLIARKIGRLGTDIYLGKRPGLALPEIIQKREKEFNDQIDEHFREKYLNDFEKSLKTLFTTA